MHLAKMQEQGYIAELYGCGLFAVEGLRYSVVLGGIRTEGGGRWTSVSRGEDEGIYSGGREHL